MVIETVIYCSTDVRPGIIAVSKIDDADKEETTGRKKLRKEVDSTEEGLRDSSPDIAAAVQSSDAAREDKEQGY